MKVYIQNNSQQGIGGGWTALRNLRKGATKTDIRFVDTWQECDVFLISGATMTDKDVVRSAKSAGKKIVFRIDNIPRDSRNRGTAFSRMLLFADLADAIIYQSEWAKEYVGWWLHKHVDFTNKQEQIIYNGVDPEHFYDSDKREGETYLYVQYNRDENKRPTEAFYDFHMRYRQNQNVKLVLVGQYSPELVQYNFDFFDRENVEYVGVIEDPKKMGDVMRRCEYIYYPSFVDASPNTLLEALSCGCHPLLLNKHGGSEEQLKVIGRTIYDMAKDYQLLVNKLYE